MYIAHFASVNEYTNIPNKIKEINNSKSGKLVNKELRIRYKKYTQHISKCDLNIAEYNKGVLHAVYGCI